MSPIINNFRIYTKKCRPLWTITFRECVSPSMLSGIPPVRDEDIDFNRKIAENYIKKYGIHNIADNITYIANYLNTKPKNNIKYVAKSSCGYSHKILTPEWQAMGYFLTMLNVVIRGKL